jgi:hypothetical protein
MGVDYRGAGGYTRHGININRPGAIVRFRTMCDARVGIRLGAMTLEVIPQKRLPKRGEFYWLTLAGGPQRPSSLHKLIRTIKVMSPKRDQAAMAIWKCRQ